MSRPPTTTSRPASRSSALVWGVRLQLERQLDPKGRALAQHAAHAHGPAHQLRQLTGDAEAEAAAADAAPHALVTAGEALEQVALRLGRQADAGVLDHKPQPDLARAARNGLDAQQDLTDAR